LPVAIIVLVLIVFNALDAIIVFHLTQNAKLSRAAMGMFVSQGRSRRRLECLVRSSN